MAKKRATLNLQIAQWMLNFAPVSPIFAAIGLADILTIGLGFLFLGIFAIVILAVLGGFATVASIWPAANVTKITTNIANSIVTGASFLAILVLLIEVGFLFVVVGLLQKLFT